MSTVISVENVSKSYRLGSVGGATLKEDFARWWANRRGKPDPLLRVGEEHHTRRMGEEFWALRDVSFQVKEGEVIGIIGRNGAGKSTLLKILSQVTSPSSGEIKIKGRIASLLEVGTGFHPELSGRENVFLNGAILGMTKVEVRKKFDEIVAFSGIEEFIDTPVKRYSSGMYVRLAFAVAAHLEPEILIVDEVLAVGDAQFQKKCLGKMDDVSKREGRTVLFVSHSMNAIEDLCRRILMLQDGTIEEDTTDVRAGMMHYLNGSVEKKDVTEWVNDKTPTSNEVFFPQRIVICSEDGLPIPQPMPNNAAAWFQIEGIINNPSSLLTIGCAVSDERGQILFWSYTTDRSEADWPPLGKGPIKIRCRFPQRMLNEGSYTLHLLASIHFQHFLFEPGISSPSVRFEIAGGLSNSPYWMNRRPGVLAPVLPWMLSVSESELPPVARKDEKLGSRY